MQALYLAKDVGSVSFLTIQIAKSTYTIEQKKK